MAAAVRLGEAVRYSNVGTVELLVDLDAPRSEPGFAFIEANARLQVEHTVTEAVTGVDLVRAQLLLAGGATLAELGLGPGEVAADPRLRRPGPGQRRDDGGRRHHPAIRRGAHRV